MMASGSHVVHQTAKGISKRIVGAARVREAREVEDGVEREGSRAEGGWYRPMLKPCILAVGDAGRLELLSGVFGFSRMEAVGDGDSGMGSGRCERSGLNRPAACRDLFVSTTPDSK
jgi:hypothetical protein